MKEKTKAVVAPVAGASSKECTSKGSIAEKPAGGRLLMADIDYGLTRPVAAMN